MRILKRLAAAAAAVCLAFTVLGTSAVFAASSPGEEIAVTAQNVTLHGKYFSKSGGYAFSYGNAGISANFTGSEFWIYVPAIPSYDGVVREVGISVLVDTDMPMEAEMFTINKAGWYCVASGLSSGEHSITIRKQNRGFFGFLSSDWFCVSKVGLASGGSLKTPDPLSDLVVEVYGDSISNGDAVWKVGNGNEAYTYGNYTGVIERLLDAEVRVCGNSGNGLLGWVMAGPSNGKLDNLYPPQKCWNVIDTQAEGANKSYSHAGANAADVVIINLGTNDRIELGNGDLTTDMFHDEYLRFVKEIKTDCPDAIVICTLGAMGGINEFGKTLERVAANANEWNGETFCYYFELQQCGTMTGGYGYDNSHPSNLAHEVYGLQLSTLINKALGLNKTLPTDIPDEAYEARMGSAAPDVDNLMNYITKKTDNLSRVDTALSGGNITVDPDDDTGSNPGPSDPGGNEPSDNGNLVVDENATITASSSSSDHAAGAAADGNVNTYWEASSGTSTSEWLSVSWKEAQKIDKIVMVWGGGKPDSGNNGAAGYAKFEYSADGSTWKTLSISVSRAEDPVDGSIPYYDTVTWNGGAITAKALRVTFSKFALNGPYQCYEFEAYGAEGGDTPGTSDPEDPGTSEPEDPGVSSEPEDPGVSSEPEGTESGDSSSEGNQSGDVTSQQGGTESDENVPAGGDAQEGDGLGGGTIAVIVVAVVIVAAAAAAGIVVAIKKKKNA